MLKCEQLESVDSFLDLDGQEMERIRTYLVSARYRGGETIFSEGDPGNAVYFILSGSAQVFRRTDRGTRRLLSRIRSSQVLGEMALLDGGPRSATATALGETHLAVLTRDSFHQLLETDPKVASLLLRRIARMLSLRLRQANAMIS